MVTQCGGGDCGVEGARGGCGDEYVGCGWVERKKERKGECSVVG